MKTVFEGKHVVVRERDGWEFAERKSATEAAAVIALTENDELILVEQYRRPVDARVIDLPAGLVEGGDDAAATAKKELEEETGYSCERVELVAKCATSPGITSELVSIFRAHGVKKTGQPEEGITVHLVPRKSAADWLRKQSALIDVKLHFVTQST